MVAMTVLETIQTLQYTDLEAAHDLLRDFIEDVFPVKVAAVVLRPLAVSLNSFNGFVTLVDGRHLFFKSHVEPGSVIAEYYNSELMEGAGYPVIRPVMASTEPDQQMLLYEVVEDQSVFDAAWDIEQGAADEGLLTRLDAAQAVSDDALWAVYADTLVWQDADAHAAAPIHQLFHHRLTQGRLDAFYGAGTTVCLPQLGDVPLEAVRRMQWTINGVTYRDTLDDIIVRGIDVLAPAQAGPAVVGHGDAHNGNVFLRGTDLVYFDPAFAGRHDPLLDLVKPFYHNTHAMWMYFPDVVAQAGGAALTLEGDRLNVTYDDRLPSVRRMFWQHKTDRVLIPLLRELRRRGWLRADWRQFFQTALACCPLLTMNLADGDRFPPSIALRGLAQVVVMGGASVDGSGPIAQWLDEVEAAL
jgi:hypothetical protein